MWRTGLTIAATAANIVILVLVVIVFIGLAAGRSHDPPGAPMPSSELIGVIFVAGTGVSQMLNLAALALGRRRGGTDPDPVQTASEFL